MNYTYLMSDCDTVLVSKEMPAIPILWQRSGLFRLIPREVIVNAIETGQSWQKTVFPPINYGPWIRWEQGIDVDPRIARILLGE